MHIPALFFICAFVQRDCIAWFVPNDFGIGIIIPLVKDRTDDLSSVSNYRGITLTTVVSKLLECVLLENCMNLLETDELQFAVKKSFSCTHAVFTLRSTVDYFNSRGSSVFAAALDVSKAFDTFSRRHLFEALTKAGIPMWIVNVIVNWYSKLSVAVRWNSTVSHFFNVKAGVRQGGILSPALFNLFINIYIYILCK